MVMVCTLTYLHFHFSFKIILFFNTFIADVALAAPAAPDYPHFSYLSGLVLCHPHLDFMLFTFMNFTCLNF